MVEALTTNIALEDLAPAGSQGAIERAPTGVTGFVGRALKGPIDEPVAINSFAEYQRVFGGLWQPSTLSYALEQFFENGGRRAIVVRVVNGGRPPTITLRCSVFRRAATASARAGTRPARAAARACRAGAGRRS